MPKLKLPIILVSVVIFIIIYILIQREDVLAPELTPSNDMANQASIEIDTTAPIVTQDSPQNAPEKNISEPTTKAEDKQSEIIINGKSLTESQKQLIRDNYGVEPVAGNFWYDSKTGAYGEAGKAASGLMYPEHDFGTLRSDASRGTSGVYINGRELTNTEVAAISALTGSPGVPGHYWMDSTGNIGIVGNSTPLINLYILARSASAGSGGGDNFWSTSFSAGNSNADNTAGYVSVPGIGPVGYGF